jgi:hypothetical protein
MGSSGLLPAKYVGRLRSDDGVGPLPAYAPRDGVKGMVRLPRRWRSAAGMALVTVLAVAGAYVEANPVHRYGGLLLIGQLTSAGDGPWSGVCCASTRPWL